MNAGSCAPKVGLFHALGRVAHHLAGVFALALAVLAISPSEARAGWVLGFFRGNDSGIPPGTVFGDPETPCQLAAVSSPDPAFHYNYAGLGPYNFGRQSHQCLALHGDPPSLLVFGEVGRRADCPPGAPYNPSNGSCTCPGGGLYSPDNGVCFISNTHELFKPYTALKLKNCGERCPRLGAPIVPATNNKFLTQADLGRVGASPLQFTRYYNSVGAPSLTMGLGWTHTYERGVFPINQEFNGFAATRADGQVLQFREVGGSFVPADADITYRFERIVAADGVPSFRLTTPDDVIEEFDSGGRMIRITDRSGLQQTLLYSDATTPPAEAPRAGLLIRVNDSLGRLLRFTYNAAGQLATLTDPDERVYTYAYTASGTLQSVTYPDTEIRTYHYNEPAHTEGYIIPSALTGITDENGARFATFSYTLRGYARSTERAGVVERYQLQHNSATSKAVTDPRGDIRTLTFQVIQGTALLTGVSGTAAPATGLMQAYSYDANGFPQSRTDWNGNRTCFKYDAARGIELVRAEGLTVACAADVGGWTPAGGTVERKITTEWHATWRLPARVCEPNRITTLAYDPKGNISSRSIQVTDDAQGALGCNAAPVGTARTWTYAYTYGTTNPAVATRIVVDGPRTDVTDTTTYVYQEANGDLLSITNALGQQTTLGSYDAHGRPRQITDPNGLATTLAWDLRGRLESRTVGAELTSYTYDGAGQPTRITLPDSSFLEYVYDAAHRLTEVRDNLGNKVTYTLDAMGNRTLEEVRDPLGTLKAKRSREYSNLNRLVKDIGGTDPAVQITQYGYDNQGNLTGVTDPLSRVTVNAYDALNRLKQITDPASGLTRYGYDGLDQLASVTDPRNNATTYTLDGLGNLSAQSSPDAGNTANTQDAAGNLVSSTDAKGQTTSFTYDALNRVTRIVYNQATGTQLKQVDYGYDLGTNGIGRLASITEISAAGAVIQTTTLSYDQQGRVTAEARAIGGTTHATSYDYDAAGRMTGMTYPSGRAVAYGLDSLGRVSRIETTASGTTQVVVQDVSYHPFGPAKGFAFGNLQAYQRTFDLDGRVAGHSVASQSKLVAFDAASRITRIEESGLPNSVVSYGYDALDRLTSTVLATSTFSYGYDAVGNRTSKSIGAATDLYSYPATSNRLAQISGSSTRTYAHDANGSVTSDGVKGWSYDARGRLVASTAAAGTTTYQVNALGQRVRKSSSLGETIFHYDTQGRLIGESSATGSPIRDYLYLGDQPVAVATYPSSSGSQCPVQPALDTSSTFVAYARRERMEVHSGRPGERGWEWGLGTNTRNFDASARADLDWVSGKPYGFVLSYDGAGNARVTVRDGATELFSLTWTGGMDVGNALRFMVKSPAGIGAGNRISVLITSIDGQPVSQSLATAGDDAFSEVVRVYAGASLQNGYSVEGTVTFTFTGRYPPRGNQLDFTVTAGNVTCQGPAQAGPPVLHYVLSDHLNTPRAVTNQAQQVVWRWENQEPFGNNPPEENPSGLGAFEFNLRFPGQYFDRETNTAYNAARDYDPATGRFLQSDPIGLVGGINPYLYVRANPLSYTDPLGLQIVVPGGGGAGGFGGLGGFGGRGLPGRPPGSTGSRELDEALGKDRNIMRLVPDSRGGGGDEGASNVPCRLAASVDLGPSASSSGNRAQCEIPRRIKQCVYTCSDGRSFSRIITTALNCPAFQNPRDPEPTLE